METTSNTNNGNLIGLTSSYQTADGVNHTAADVWFTVKPSQASTANQLAKAIGTFVDSSGPVSELPLNLGAAIVRTNEVFASTAQIVSAIRSFETSDLTAGLDSISVNPSNATATSSSLAVGLPSEEKVKPNLLQATSANNLFVSK